MRLSVQVQALFYGIDYHNYCNTFAGLAELAVLAVLANHPASQALPLHGCRFSSSPWPALAPYFPYWAFELQ